LQFRARGWKFCGCGLIGELFDIPSYNKWFGFGTALDKGPAWTTRHGRTSWWNWNSIQLRKTFLFFVIFMFISWKE